MVESVRMPPCACPKCQARLDAATDAAGGDAVPKPGDLTICIHCTAVLQFDAARMPVLVDEAARASMDAVTQVRLMLAIRHVKEFQQWRRWQ